MEVVVNQMIPLIEYLHTYCFFHVSILFVLRLQFSSSLRKTSRSQKQPVLHSAQQLG
jgi:hypothetical protein